MRSLRSARCSGFVWRHDVLVLTAEGVGLDEFAGLGVHPRDVGLELLGFDSPLTTPTDLDRRQLPGADQGIRLGRRDIQRLGDIGKGEESFSHERIVPFRGRRGNHLWIRIGLRAPSRVMLPT